MAIKPLPTDQSAYVGTDGKPATVFYTWLKSLADAVNGLLALFPGGTSSTAWTAYTPIVTAATGTITSYIATGRYYQLGKVVFVQISVQITNAGTGTDRLIVTLPITSNSSFTYSLAGWEDDTPIGAASIMHDGSNVDVRSAAGSSLIFTGADVTLCGTYEAA